MAANISILYNHDVMEIFNKSQKYFIENITVNYIGFVNGKPIKICD